MKLNWFVVATLVGLLAASGCKKDNKAAGGGSAATGSAAAGSAAAGGGTMAGSAAGGGTMTDDSAGGSAAAGGGAGASMSDADIETMIKDLLAMMTDMSKAVEGKDCAGAAAGINGVLDAHKAFIDKAKAVSDDKSIEERAEKIMEAGGWEKKLDEAAEGLGPVAEKCENDAAFKAAMDRLDQAVK